MLSMPVRMFLRGTFNRQRPSLLVTPPGVRASPFVIDALRFYRGHWIVDDGRDAYDGLSGRRLEKRPGRVPRPVADEPPPEPPAPGPDALGAFFFEVYARGPVQRHPFVGPVVEHMVAGLGSPASATRLEQWGLDEPLTSPWEPERLDLVMRAQLPGTDRMLATGPGGVCVTTGIVRWNNELVERSRGVVPAGPFAAPAGLPAGEPLAAHPIVLPTLAELDERFNLDLAMVSYGPLDFLDESGEPVGRPPGPWPKEEPLALLIGSHFIRAVGIDVPALASRFDLTPIGSHGTPAALLRFFEPDPLWRPLLDFGRGLKLRHIAPVLGLPMYD